ncbi:MAG: hypothetical protein R3E46_14730 [Sedimenticolaceae bacterium]
MLSDRQAGFEQNEIVQDSFGGLSKQHHAAVAGHDTGTLLVAWDDEREGNVDVMLSWYEAGGWSDDWPTLPGASGPGLRAIPRSRWTAMAICMRPGLNGMMWTVRG